jgi:hypothetical protein
MPAYKKVEGNLETESPFKDVKVFPDHTNGTINGFRIKVTKNVIEARKEYENLRVQSVEHGEVVPLVKIVASFDIVRIFAEPPMQFLFIPRMEFSSEPALLGRISAEFSFNGKKTNLKGVLVILDEELEREIKGAMRDAERERMENPEAVKLVAKKMSMLSKPDKKLGDLRIGWQMGNLEMGVAYHNIDIADMIKKSIIFDANSQKQLNSELQALRDDVMWVLKNDPRIKPAYDVGIEVKRNVVLGLTKKVVQNSERYYAGDSKATLLPIFEQAKNEDALESLLNLLETEAYKKESEGLPDVAEKIYDAMGVLKELEGEYRKRKK